MIAENSKKQPRGKPFAKGKSGNPGGRPKLNPEQKDALEAIKALAPNAADVIAELLNNKNASAAVRLEAASMIIERVYGKPDAKVTIVKPDYTALRSAFDELAGDQK
jgi:hypothetical protein